tara:strand:- start:3181 stop:4098 length:918 start_codon:yes stop_codon:yes gene_type:complete
MNIYSCIDNKNISKIFVLFYSVFINCSNKNKLNFYLLIENNIDEIELNALIPNFLEGKIKIKSLESLSIKKWHNTIKEFNKFFYIQGHKCNNIMNFARFFIFLAFPEIDRFIYLDWDMIVHTDILNLEKEYEKNELIVANSINFDFSTIVGNISNLSKRNFSILNAKKIIDSSIFKIDYKKIKNDIIKKYDAIIYNVTSHKNSAKDKSFNSGFYIVSKKMFDQESLYNLIHKLILIQKKEKVFRFGTQVIMNLLSIKNVIFVDYKWNNKPDINNFISHWNGGDKPWESKDELWMKYFNEMTLKVN